jgi:hypothetical protein
MIDVAEAEEHEGADGQWHNQPRTEHGREQRGERPHRGLGLGIPAPAAPLELTETEEEQYEHYGIHGEHGRDGAGVAPGVVDGDWRATN